MEQDGQRQAMWGVVAQYVGAGLGLIMIGLDQGLVAYMYALVPALAIPIVANLLGLRPHLRDGESKIDLHMWKTIGRRWPAVPGLGGDPVVSAVSTSSCSAP